MKHKQESWIKEFREYGDSVYWDWSGIDPDLIEYVRKLLAQERKRQKTKIGMLRQWLNETIGKDSKRFVTNEDIEIWLES